jgi:hypothetical protein
MPGQGRLGDKANTSADAHGCPGCPHPGTGPAIQGSANVLVNGRPALRVDDVGIHAVCCGPNMWQAQQGAPTVFINGKAAFRMNDPTRHCGGQGKLVEGSSDVIIGDAAGGGGGGGAGGGGSGGAGGGSGGAGGGGAARSGSGAGGSAGGAGSGANATTAGGAAANASSSSANGDDDAKEIEPDAIEVHVLDSSGKPITRTVYYELTLPDGAKRTGISDGSGVIKITALTQRGECTIVFPDVDDQQPNKRR